MNLNENIFWKMIHNQKNKDPNKPENIELKPRPSLTKPMKKLNSTFLERIEKKEQMNPTSQILYRKRGSLKALELQELEKIEKLSTFNKVIKLQNFCKEMISTKERFGKNKSEMINKINKNCYNYYKNKIKMKEIYDYCQSKKPEEHIDYVLIENPELYLDIKYDNIYNFLFMLRNNNKMMLKLIQYCPEVNYEQLSDFIVNFFYEDTINSSFIQEELMLLIYLIFEKNLYEKLPNEIKIEDNNISFDIFRNKKNILYYIIKSLTRKADIRNFLCSILVENILKLEGNRKYLSPDVFSQKNLDDVFQENDKDENRDKGNTVQILKKYCLSGELDYKIKSKFPFDGKIYLNRACTNNDESNKYEENLDEIKENEVNNYDKNNSKNNSKKMNELVNKSKKRKNNLVKIKVKKKMPTSVGKRNFRKDSSKKSPVKLKNLLNPRKSLILHHNIITEKSDENLNKVKRKKKDKNDTEKINNSKNDLDDNILLSKNKNHMILKKKSTGIIGNGMFRQSFREKSNKFFFINQPKIKNKNNIVIINEFNTTTKRTCSATDFFKKKSGTKKLNLFSTKNIINTINNIKIKEATELEECQSYRHRRFSIQNKRSKKNLNENQCKEEPKSEKSFIIINNVEDMNNLNSKKNLFNSEKKEKQICKKFKGRNTQVFNIDKMKIKTEMYKVEEEDS
jgi:hypothetical protein